MPERKEAEVPMTMDRRTIKERKTKGKSTKVPLDHSMIQKCQIILFSSHQASQTTTKLTTIKRMSTGPPCV